MFPIIVILASAMGVVAGWGSSIVLLDMSNAEFLKGLRLFFEPWDVQFAAIKSVSFGLIVTGVGSFYGFHTKGGAAGVGIAATRSVVLASILILALDAFWAVVLL